MRHIDFLRCGAGELGAVVAGAERLLHHSRIGVFSVDSPISPDLVQAAEDHRYRLVSRTLAVHERLLPLIERGPKSMLDLAALCRRHGIAPHGFVHVGAHEGREFETYRSMGARDMLFIEANPAVFARLAANLAAAPGVVLSELRDRRPRAARHAARHLFRPRSARSCRLAVRRRDHMGIAFDRRD